MRRALISKFGPVVMASLLVVACGGAADDDQTEQQAEQQAGEDTGEPTSDAVPTAGTREGMTRVADITGEPNEYVGRRVTIEADVEEVWTGYAFSLDEDAAFEGGVDNDLLVFSPKSANLTEIDDQWMDNKVRVTGNVRMMSVVELERELGWDLDPELEVELETVRPVVIAESIVRADAPY